MDRKVGWLILAIMWAGCSSPQSGTAPVEGVQEAAPGPVAGQNYPQEELARKKDSIKLSGTLNVPGYEKGRLQIDVYLPTRSIEGVSPLTTARVAKPGPWELLLPAGTKEVQLMAILDFQENGPDATDATAEYAANPVNVGEKTTGIEITLDKANTKMPPPQNATDNRPPWEGAAGTGTGTGTGAGAGSGTGAGQAAAPPAAPPQGKAVPAPPGAPGGGTGTP